jgi:hypothetical protein
VSFGCPGPSESGRPVDGLPGDENSRWGSFLRIRSARAREWARFVAWTGFVVALALVTRDVGFVVVLAIGYGATLVVFVVAGIVGRRRRSSRQPPDGS